CLAGMLGWRAMVRLRFRYVLISAVTLAVVIFATPIIDVLGAYWQAYQGFALRSTLRRDDPSFLAGRQASLTCVAEMVKAHPLLGVGLGNYSLLRADPKIGIPDADVWDLPGIGLLSYLGDMGIPLFLYFVWIIWMPLRIIRKSRAPDVMLLLAGFQ